MNSLQDLLSLIEFFKDSGKVAAKIKELQDENKRLEDNMKASGIVGNINDLKALADQNVDAAKKVLAEAKEQSDKIVADAKSKYDARNAAIAKREAEADKVLAEARNTLAEAEKVRKDTRDNLDTQIASLAAIRADLEAQRAEVTDRLAKLQSVMG